MCQEFFASRVFVIRIPLVSFIFLFSSRILLFKFFIAAGVVDNVGNAERYPSPVVNLAVGGERCSGMFAYDIFRKWGDKPFFCIVQRASSINFYYRQFQVIRSLIPTSSLKVIGFLWNR